MENQRILILNFGGQYDQLIARRVRECSVYCEVKPYTMTLSEIQAFDPIGIIFTGGPDSVYKENSYHPAEENENAREYGKTLTFYDNSCLLFDGLDEESISWMSHGDYMKKVPEGFRLVAYSGKCPNVAICDENRKFYGVQFHPEVNHTENGTAMIRNFLYKVCGAAGDWTMEGYMHRCIEEIRSKVGNGKVLLALSGGVDSSVCAALFAEAVGSQLTCVFVDHGLPEYMVMRQPFPGPGLAIRVIGEITKEKLDILRNADAIVTTEDFMTADWSRIPYGVLDKVSSRIVNEVPHVNRVLYDITSKPPATVEFE